MMALYVVLGIPVAILACALVHVVGVVASEMVVDLWRRYVLGIKKLCEAPAEVQRRLRMRGGPEQWEAYRKAREAEERQKGCESSANG